MDCGIVYLPSGEETNDFLNHSQTVEYMKISNNSKKKNPYMHGLARFTIVNKNGFTLIHFTPAAVAAFN